MKNPSSDFITLGEGNTPLLRLYSIEKKLGWQGNLWAKCEYQNPTGSFKDRGSIVEISEAIRQKKSGVVCASTGNMAASLSAYAARAKLPCRVVIPKGTQPGKIKQSLANGAYIVEVKGNYDACVEKARELAQEKRLLLCGDYELRRNGQQSAGEELAKSKIVFDAFVVPVGNGTLGCAISQGFAKYNVFPSFIGVQGQGADPIYQAWKNGNTVVPLSQPNTIASAMNVGNPLDGALTLEWVKKTKGLLFSVLDEEIVASQKLLAQTEGIFVEKAAAATVAGLQKLTNPKLNTVLILTGSGLKEN